MAAPTADLSAEIAPLPPGFDGWREMLDLIQRAFAHMHGLIDPPSSAYRLTAQSLAEKCAAESVFIAKTDGRLAGCILLSVVNHHAYVGKLAVEPNLQGLGIGRRLMATAEAEARRRGLNAIELQTRIELTGNHSAFARLGFRETARTAHAGYDRPTSITMRKDLAV